MRSIEEITGNSLPCATYYLCRVKAVKAILQEYYSQSTLHAKNRGLAPSEQP